MVAFHKHSHIVKMCRYLLGIEYVSYIILSYLHESSILQFHLGRDAKIDETTFKLIGKKLFFIEQQHK